MHHHHRSIRWLSFAWTRGSTVRRRRGERRDVVLRVALRDRVRQIRRARHLAARFLGRLGRGLLFLGMCVVARVVLPFSPSPRPSVLTVSCARASFAERAPSFHARRARARVARKDGHRAVSTLAETFRCLPRAARRRPDVPGVLVLDYRGRRARGRHQQRQRRGAAR